MDAAPEPTTTYRFGDFELDAGSRTLRSRVSGNPVPLTSRAFDLLLLFVRRPNVPLGKRELMELLWPDSVVEDGNLDQAIFALRQALEERRGEHRYIKTIHRRGYQFAETVQLIATPTSAPNDASTTTVAPPVPPTRLRFVVLIALAVVVAAGVAIHWWAVEHPVFVAGPVSPASPPPPGPRFSVLYFRAARDPAGVLLADTMTRLLYERFAAIRALTVLDQDSGWDFRRGDVGANTYGKRLRARYVLWGDVVRSGDHLRVKAELRDVEAGAPLWSRIYDVPLEQLTALREDILAHSAAAMHVDPAVTDEAARAPVSFEVYQLYCRARQLIVAGATIDEMEQAVALFTRTTTLDPTFARGYEGLAEALLFAANSKPNISGIEKSDIVVRARTALDRALELNPALAEAWAERARLIDDPAQAEKLFRLTLRLAPGYTLGSLHFAQFLSRNNRAGEALDVMRRARDLAPTTVWLYGVEAGMLMRSRSDVDGTERLLREGMALDPEHEFGRRSLAIHLQYWRGQVAESVRILEHVTDREAGDRAELATAYLEVDDPAAAVQVWNDSRVPPPFQLIFLAQYRRDWHGAARVARQALSGTQTYLYSRAAEALRDEAMLTGDYAEALKILGPVFEARSWIGADSSEDQSLGTVYAHTLALAGQAARGREIARSLLVELDADEIGRPAHWFGRQRAGLLMLLGDHDRALVELAAGQHLNQWFRWWYTGEIDPLFTPVRNDPRFQLLCRRAREQRSTQRALVEEMRRRGEIPLRGGRRASAAAAHADR